MTNYKVYNSVYTPVSSDATIITNSSSSNIYARPVGDTLDIGVLIEPWVSKEFEFAIEVKGIICLLYTSPKPTRPY